MKTLKYSLAALLALGAFSCINAEEVKANQADQQNQDKSIPPSTKTSIMDALEGTTIGGYVYGQVTSMFGSDASGTAFRARTLIDVNTGAYYGFSIGTRVFASIGQGGPNGGTFLENSGSNPTNLLDLGLYALYGRKTFESSATVITMGKMNITTPFSDSAWDYGYGVGFDNYDVKGIGFHLQAYGAWGLDNGNEINPRLEPNKETKKDERTTNPKIASEKGLFIFGVSGKNTELAGVGFNVWAGHAIDTIDFLTYADVDYTISGVKIGAKVATTQVNTGNKFFAATTKDGKDLSAKLRGLYNIQVSYDSKENGLMAAVGYTGSYGDGYGALLNYAAFNMGGKIWYDTLSSGANGYGIGGSGGFKNLNGDASTIQVIYASLGYKGVKNLSIGIDYAYVAGNNNYTLMKKGIANNTVNNKEIYNQNAKMHEVSVSAAYAFTDKLSLSALVGSTFGDLQMGRARLKLNYAF